MFIGVIIQAIFEISAIAAMTMVAMSVASPEAILHNHIARFLFVHFPFLSWFSDDLRRLAFTCVLMSAALVCAKNGEAALIAHKTNTLGQSIALFAGDAIFHNFLHRPYICHLSGDSDAMFQALSRRNQLGSLLVLLMNVYSYAMITFLMIAALLALTPVPVLLIMSVIMLIAIILYRRLRALMDRAGRVANTKSNEESKATLNAMRGLRELLIYRQQDIFFEKFETACIEGAPPRAFLSIAPTVPTWILESAGFFSIVAAMAIMWGILDSSLAEIAGVMTIIILVAWRILPLLNRSLSALVAVRGMRDPAMQCLDKVREALAEKTAKECDPDPDFAIRESIALDHMSFRYPGSEADALIDISCVIPRGAKMGIIGPSGAGKSTLAAILSALVAPEDGAFLIDGMVPTQAGIAAYRSRIGYVAQQPYILAGSIAENVAFSQWGKPWDEERVLRACRMACLDIALERGVDYPLGEGGAGLSGGQMQRVAIARALYANPDVLILDEATSALDSGLEAEIMNIIFALPANITIVIIAHRLSTVEHCDTLLWIENGRLRDSGPPAEILPEYQTTLAKLSSQGSREDTNGSN